MLIKKITKSLFFFVAASALLTSVYAQQNYRDGLIVDKITHFGDHIRIGFSGHGQNDWGFNDGVSYNMQAVPPTESGTFNSVTLRFLVRVAFL
jgi:hypothetical protein